jgi:hypothetical protein
MNSLKRIFFLIFFFGTLSAFSQETVAILPFTFTDEGHLSIEKGKEVQQFLAGYISKKQKHFKVTPLNTRDINVGLNKAGITAETIDNFTTSEIAEVLNADFILMGSVDRSFEGTSELESGFGSINQKDWKQANVYAGSSSTTTKKYHATVYISIFKRAGTVIYDKNKANIFIDTTPDSWKNSVIWQVRHFPFYE